MEGSTRIGTAWDILPPNKIMLHHKGTLWSNKNMRSFENGFKFDCKCVSKCTFTYKCKCTRRCKFIDKFWRQVIHMSWMRSWWWQIKRTRCASLVVTREHINDAAKTIKNTREPIQNVVRMTTLQNVRAKQELMMIQSCKNKTKNEDENQASLSCENKHETPSRELWWLLHFITFGH